ncbi:MAG: hypothetical protein Q4F05_11210 [bacterium]|nr:hypothetical protein [bacterium]
MEVLQSGAVSLPCPTTISVDDEIIWSSNTGRNASGLMTGDVIAEKKNVAITWGVLKQSDVSLIRKYIKSGFFNLTLNIGETITITCYRGSLSVVPIGKLDDGTYYYRSATATAIQQ